MATKSTPEQNDPKADNRAEYSVPPVASDIPSDFVCEVDADGFEVLPDTTEVIESDDSVAS